MSKLIPLKIIFAGTPDISKDVLKHLIDTKHNIIASLTQPDRPSGRGKKNKASPVKILSIQNNIPIMQPYSFTKNPEFINEIKELRPDIIIVIAYGIILPQELLDIPKYGCINIHVSLLSKYRGAAPIQRAILNGDNQTGVTIMQMDSGLDTGDIIHTSLYPMKEKETSSSLHEALKNISCKAITKTLFDINNNNIIRVKQPLEGVSYAQKLSKKEAQIDWNDSSEQIERNIRGYNPWPVAYMIIDNIIIKVWDSRISNNTSKSIGKIISISKDGIEVSTGTTNIILLTIQYPGKKPLPLKEILNGKNLDHLVGLYLNNHIN